MELTHRTDVEIRAGRNQKLLDISGLGHIADLPENLVEGASLLAQRISNKSPALLHM
jgi:hypothetical protein